MVRVFILLVDGTNFCEYFGDRQIPIFVNGGKYVREGIEIREDASGDCERIWRYSKENGKTEEWE